MWVSVPFISFIVFWGGFYGYARRRPQVWLAGREAFFYAIVLWGVVVCVLTEALSAIHALSFFPLLIGWLLVLGCAGYWFYPFWQAPSIGFLRRVFYDWSLTEKIFFLVLVAIAGIKGFSALMSAPNTCDAMTYHLARVEHWVQNATVAHYPTQVSRQLYSPPWAEYAILHLRILSVADYLSNSVQWFACLGSWAGVSALAFLLGADRRGQLLSALLAATLPMGLVQSTSTQTDYVATLWFVLFVYFLWSTYQRGRWGQALAASASLGLALLTKGYSYVFAPAWIMIYAMAALRRRDKQRLKLLVLMVAGALLFVVPYALRNTSTFGKPNWTHIPLTNAKISLSSVLGNVVCNSALHLGTPWGNVNNFIKEGLNGTAKFAGFDLNRPDGGDSFAFQALSTGEDDTGNLTYVLLLVVLLPAMFFVPKLRSNTHYWLYTGAVAATGIVFCMVIHFNPFNSRFHLPIFVLSTALMGTVFSELLRRWVLPVGVLVVVLAWPWLLACNEHPLIGARSILRTSRIQQYFSERPDFILPYAVAVRLVQAQDCHEVGLIQGEDDWEYPWWMFFHQVYGNRFRLEHVAVNNLTAPLSYPQGAFFPCALIASRDTRTVIPLGRDVYVRVWGTDLPEGPLSVFIPIPHNLNH